MSATLSISPFSNFLIITNILHNYIPCTFLFFPFYHKFTINHSFFDIFSFPAFSLICIPEYGVTTERKPNVSWLFAPANNRGMSWYYHRHVSPWRTCYLSVSYNLSKFWLRKSSFHTNLPQTGSKFSHKKHLLLIIIMIPVTKEIHRN